MRPEHSPPDTQLVAVTGATGFIGMHLLKRLEEGGLPVRALSRNGVGSSGAEWVKGDLLHARSVEQFLDGASLVVHLAFSRDAPPELNVRIGENLARGCVYAGAERLIHCSTAEVAGPGGPAVVTESTACKPRTPYQKTKFELERIIHHITDEKVLTISLRPTSVFGPGGRGLVSLVHPFISGQKLGTLVRSTLHGHRTMNLVPVENVITAIELLLNDEKQGGFNPGGGPLIVSADDDPRNEFRQVELLIAEAIGRGSYRGSRISAPAVLLSLLQRLRRGEYSPPGRLYLSEHPAWRERTRSVDLGQAIQEFSRGLLEGGL